jgi:hypothetical protein
MRAATADNLFLLSAMQFLPHVDHSLSRYDYCFVQFGVNALYGGKELESLRNAGERASTL